MSLSPNGFQLQRRSSRRGRRVAGRRGAAGWAAAAAGRVRGACGGVSAAPAPHRKRGPGAGGEEPGAGAQAPRLVSSRETATTRSWGGSSRSEQPAVQVRRARPQVFPVPTRLSKSAVLRVGFGPQPPGGLSGAGRPGPRPAPRAGVARLDPAWSPAWGCENPPDASEVASSVGTARVNPHSPAARNERVFTGSLSQ